VNPQMLGGYCRGQPWGSPLTTVETPLKTCKKTKAKHASLKHTRHGPRHGGLDGPPRRPTQRSPRAGSASLEGTHLPRVGSAPFEGVRLPRAGSASLEGPHRPRGGSASLEGAPHAHARSLTRVRAFNALTTPGGAIMHLGLTPRFCCTNSLGGNPSPPLWGTVRRGRCQSRDAVPPTPVRLTRRALEGGPAAPSICFPVTLQV
jgi:hypothetical protein